MGCASRGIICETCEAKPPSLVEKILEFQVPVANIMCVPQILKANRCEQQTLPPSRGLFSLTEPVEHSGTMISINPCPQLLRWSVQCKQATSSSQRKAFALSPAPFFLMLSNECLTNRSSFSRSLLFSLALALFSSVLFDKCVPLRMLIVGITYHS